MSASSPRGPTPALSVAPMMDHTDRHLRWLLRQLTRRTLLYTEMVTTGALLHGPRARLLGLDPVEHPVALQLGGDDPDELATCARLAFEAGFDEVNLNVGCPSDRVAAGSFGAVLMRRPERVAQAVAAMRAAVPLPVTVKHRIGVDELDRYEDMLRFVDIVAEAGADRFTVHARKAWLQGLSPKENRTVPPLRHEEVWRLKAARPGLHIELNGGIRSLEEVATHLAHVDAVMLGRAVIEDPWLLRQADARVFGEEGPGLVDSREALVARLRAYAQDRLAEGERLGPVIRHVLPLFNGQPGARAWRRLLSERAFHGEAPVEVLDQALAARDAAAHREAV